MIRGKERERVCEGWIEGGGVYEGRGRVSSSLETERTILFHCLKDLVVSISSLFTNVFVYDEIYANKSLEMLCR